MRVGWEVVQHTLDVHYMSLLIYEQATVVSLLASIITLFVLKRPCTMNHTLVTSS